MGRVGSKVAREQGQMSKVKDKGHTGAHANPQGAPHVYRCDKHVAPLEDRSRSSTVKRDLSYLHTCRINK